MKIVKCPKSKDIHCTCGGQVMVDGEGTYTIPVGFGFHNDQKFHVDSIRLRGYAGVCLGCQSKVFAYTSRKPATKTLALRGA